MPGSAAPSIGGETAVMNNQGTVESEQDTPTVQSGEDFEQCKDDAEQISTEAGSATITELTTSDNSMQDPMPKLISKDESREPPARKRRQYGSSSMDLRRLPSNILLSPDLDLSETEGDDYDDLLGGSMDHYQRKGGLQRCLRTVICLSPRFKLKTQLMLSFGIVNATTVGFVILVTILSTFLAADGIKNTNQQIYETKLVLDVQATTVRYIAESLEVQFMPVDLVDMFIEVAQDRFQGYPKSLVEDRYTPFRDSLTGDNIYPIQNVPLLMDWEVQRDVNETNYKEHSDQSRWNAFLQKQRATTTANGIFLLQGACDPDETDEMSPNFFPNCTTANNDVTVGGVINPDPSAGPIYRMGSDIIPFMKAMYESKPQVRDVGLYFRAMGSGAAMWFPGYPVSTQTTYESIGCEWLAEPNPLDPTLGSIGTEYEIRRCHKKGELVSGRLYSAMERGWCRDQALNPRKMFLDVYVDAFSENNWILSLGRALYDRQTLEFVACSYIGISLSLIEQSLDNYTVTDNSEITVVQFGEEGAVIASTAISSTSNFNGSSSELQTIDQLNVGLSQKSYQELHNLVNYTDFGVSSAVSWDAEAIRTKYEEFSYLEDGFIVAVAPIPGIPDEYDPEYVPSFFIVLSLHADDVFVGSEVLTDEVDAHVNDIFWFSLIAGAVGLLVSTAIIVLMATAITSPLHFINTATDEIVKSFGDPVRVNDDKGTPEDQKKRARPKAESVTKYFTPRTELSDVLQEFNKMVTNFSGTLLARSGNCKRIETKNRFNQRTKFSKLYDSRKAVDFKYHLSKAPRGQAQPEEMDGSSSSIDPLIANYFVNMGSNLNFSGPSLSTRNSTGSGNASRSRLFLWTAALIVTPLLLTTTTISTVVLRKTWLEFGKNVNQAQDFFLNLRLRVIAVHATLRGELVSNLVGVSVRDLNILTRYYEWLLFGGINRTNSFPEILSGTNECRPYSDNITACPWRMENYVCDCAWNSKRVNVQCQEYPDGSRHLQRAHFSAQFTDSLPDGDRRNSSSYPAVSYSPETTLWWPDATTVPGGNATSSSGYDTLYDRLQVAASMPLFPVLYNYDSLKKNYIGQYIAFESDGLFVGYAGCSTPMSSNSFWSSSEANGAAKNRPELCPLGKYGYDPR